MSETQDKPQTMPPVPPFVQFVAAAVPMVFDDSLSYYEALCALWKYLSDTVNVVNNNATVTEDYIQLTDEMKSYMNNYFDNLDVQDEINQKLDEMAEDGVLSSLISPYVDAKFVPFETTISNQIATIDDKVDAVSSGSPAGVYATAAALSTADPDHSKIYVVSADGKWYYYNTGTSTWTAGGTYQSSAIGDNTVGLSNFDTSVKNHTGLQVLTPNYTTPQYIRHLSTNYYGSVNTDANSGASMSEEISVKANQIVQVMAKGHNGNVCIISIVITKNGTKTYYPQVIDDGTNVAHYYTWRAKNDCTIVVCSLNNGLDGKLYLYDDFVKFKDIESQLPEQPVHHNLIIDNDIKTPNPSRVDSTSYSIINGDDEYPYVLDIDIDYEGGNVGDSGWAYYCLRDITFPSSIDATSITLAVDIKSKDSNQFAIVGCLPNKSANFNFYRDLFANSLIITDLSATTYKRYYFTIPFASLKTMTSIQFGVIQPAGADAFQAGYQIRYMGYAFNADIPQLASNPLTQSDYDYLDQHYIGENLFTAFNKFGVIGDSLASGESVSNAGGSNVYVDNYDYSWGQFIAKDHGLECINFSKGGLTTRSWLTSPYGLAKLQATGNECNAYIIGLGVNDANHLGAGYIGSQSDIHIDDPSQNADSFYGNYGKIISAIKGVQAKAKIFIFTIPEKESQYTAYNTAIRNIATIFDEVYCIDLASTKYIDNFTLGFFAAQRRVGHYNAIGYKEISDVIYKILGNYMFNNYSDFNQIEFIGTDYSYSS